jgi:hypothetical protein
MNKEFIPYEQALELKELGFNEPCLAFYDGKGTNQVYYNNVRNGSGDYEPFKNTERLKWFGAPLYQQALRWFREKHNICGYIIETTNKYNKLDGKFQYGISNSYYDVYDTYEEAELACLNKLIELIKKGS